MKTRRARYLALLGFLSAPVGVALAPSEARADGFATPPGDDNHVAVAEPRVDRRFDDDVPPSFVADDKLSVIRFLVGPSAKFDAESAAPGLLVATDIGKGPAGLRLTGAWMNVGTDHGISQYTGELTLDFGGRSRIRPVVGAGGGVARTSSSQKSDGTLDTEHGATLGIGIVRGGIGLRLPLEDADARVQLDVTGAFPAIRGDSAPDGLTPWAMASLTVGVGF